MAARIAARLRGEHRPRPSTAAARASWRWAAGRRALIRGDFFADPPRVELTPPSHEQREEKERFESRAPGRLVRWLIEQPPHPSVYPSRIPATHPAGPTMPEGGPISDDRARRDRARAHRRADRRAPSAEASVLYQVARGHPEPRGAAGVRAPVLRLRVDLPAAAVRAAHPFRAMPPFASRSWTTCGTRSTARSTTPSCGCASARGSASSVTSPRCLAQRRDQAAAVDLLVGGDRCAAGRRHRRAVRLRGPGARGRDREDQRPARSLRRGRRRGPWPSSRCIRRWTSSTPERSAR